MDRITEMDLGINLFIQENLRFPYLNEFMKGYTALNNFGLITIGIVIAFLLFRTYRSVGFVMAASLVLQALLNNVILKPLVARIRPYELSKEVILLVEKAKDYSFPSGHTGSSFAIGVVAYLMLPKRYGRIAIGLAGLMGFSRLYVGIHYPTDVIGAILLGSGTALLSHALFKKYAGHEF